MVKTERYEAVVPANLSSSFDYLFSETCTILIIRGHEYIDAFFLQFFSNRGSNFRRRGGTDDGGKTGSRAINEFNPTFPQNNIIGCAEPDVGIGFFRIFLTSQVGRVANIFKGLFHIKGKKGCHTGIEARSQVGSPAIVDRHISQQLTTSFHDRQHVTQGLNLYAGDAVNDRQIIGSIGQGNCLILTIFFNGGINFALNSVNHHIGATNSGTDYLFRHILILQVQTSCLLCIRLLSVK